MRWFVIFAGITACHVPDVQLTGKDCPCPDGWYCDQTNTCVSGAEPDAAIDTRDSSSATTYRDAVIADAPLGYWRLGDSGGTTAHDEMGTYDGVYSGTCMFGVPGALADDANTAVVFDGSSCQITLPNQLGFLATAPYSVEAWIRPAATSGFRMIFSKESRGVTGPMDGYALVDSSTGAYLERAVGGVAPTTPHVTLPANQYVHLVGVFDGAALVLYIDAVAGIVFADTAEMPAFNAAALIGADSSGDWFEGALDEIAVYDHVLTADRIALHYQLGVSGP